MKEARSLSALLLLSFFKSCTSPKKMQAVKQDEVLKAMRLANDYFINKWPDAGKTIVTNQERPSNIWTRSVYYEGLMVLNSIDPQRRYYEYALQWGDKHQWG